ncbi:MAG TPA: signal peptidase I [Candidatus Methylomirabilis sp.]|nr:signal peptidase I [Candidatus Methylomirabilis sp.]
MKVRLVIFSIICAITLLILFSDISFLTVTGTSMDPLITQNDIIIIAPVNPYSLKVGDIITYERNIDGKSIKFTHRIISIKNGVIKTKGDSMPREDSYNVHQQDVKGIVVGKIPYIGMLPHFARTTAGYVLLILLPAFMLITNQIIKIRRLNR